MPVGWSLARIAAATTPAPCAVAAAQAKGLPKPVLAAIEACLVQSLGNLPWFEGRTISLVDNSGSVWTIGLIGTALGLISSGWLTRFAELMVLLGSILVPVGGVFLSHFVVLKKPIVIARSTTSIATCDQHCGIAAWITGFIVYKLAAPIGATLPALATSMVIYALLANRPTMRLLHKFTLT
jgi:hypothetical protein